MRRDGRNKGAGKGPVFERATCVALSLWVTHGAARDLFWRSAMSGGRATRGLARGEKLSRQAGDITAVAPEGHVLTSRYYIELKHYADLALVPFFVKQSGMLAGFWMKTVAEATKHGRQPMMIVKQNRVPTMIVTRIGEVDVISRGRPSACHVHLKGHLRCEVHLLEDVLCREFTGDTGARE